MVHMVPPPGSVDFEETKCPYIELAEADLPWRYTPELAAGPVLRPWIVLVVGTPQEVQLHEGTVTLTNAVLVAHDLTRSARWAHVQDDSDHPGQRLVARLLSPRDLDPTTDYVAVVVPAFAANGDPSWTSATAQIELPAFASWRFRTATEGDFPTLASRPGTGRRRRRPRSGTADLHAAGRAAGGHRARRTGTDRRNRSGHPDPGERRRRHAHDAGDRSTSTDRRSTELRRRVDARSGCDRRGVRRSMRTPVTVRSPVSGSALGIDEQELLSDAAVEAGRFTRRGVTTHQEPHRRAQRRGVALGRAASRATRSVGWRSSAPSLARMMTASGTVLERITGRRPSVAGRTVLVDRSPGLAQGPTASRHSRPRRRTTSGTCSRPRTAALRRPRRQGSTPTTPAGGSASALDDLLERPRRGRSIPSRSFEEAGLALRPQRLQGRHAGALRQRDGVLARAGSCRSTRADPGPARDPRPAGRRSARTSGRCSRCCERSTATHRSRTSPGCWS